MRFKFKALLSGAAVAAVAGGGLLSAAPAFASSPPQTLPVWEVDGNAAPPYGNIVFYDANGVSVTSGTNDLSTPFAYAVATTHADTGANTANLYYYTPEHGVVPASWGGSEESSSAFSPIASLPAGTPATVAADAPTYPVVQVSGADIAGYVSGSPSDTTAGYDNILQVRIVDSGPGGKGNASNTYWETDIAFNQTGTATTVDGTSVPAEGWAQLFPFTTPASSNPTLAVTPTGSSVNSGTPVTLTASNVPTSPAGSVVFEDNGTAIDTATPSAGTASYTFTPAVGSHSYTAIYVPSVGTDETGANSTSAAQVSSAASTAVSQSVVVPTIATSTALALSSGSIAYGGSETMTATVTESDAPTTAGLAGNVMFYDGATALTTAPGVAATVGASSSTASFTTTSLPAGTDSITAVFTPTDTAYGSSTSPAMTVTVAAPAACSLTGSQCTDQQNITVTVNPGTITITTPYTPTNQFVLPAMTLSSDGTYLSSSATFPATTNPNSQQIVVTSSLAPAYAWTLSVSASSLSDGSGGTISNSGLGITNGKLLDPGPGANTYPGGVTFTNIPAHNPSPVDTDTNLGLSTTPQSWGHSTAADGTAVMDGTLTLLAPTSTPPGTYTGTITFTVS